MFVVDTNILLYAANADAPERSRCQDLFDHWRILGEPWFLTWGIVYEFLRVATHSSIFRSPLTPEEAWAFLSSVFASPSLRFLQETDRHGEIAQEVFQQNQIKGNFTFDARTAILMKEHGLRKIYTRDMDFQRFDFLEVINPLRPGD